MTRLAGVVAACLVLALVPAAAKKKKGPRPTVIAALPEWAREALERAPAESEHDVVWLHEEYRVRPVLEGGVDVTVRRAGRVYNTSGIEVAGDISMQLTDEDEVRSISGWVVRPDGTVMPIDPAVDITDYPAVPGAHAFYDGRVQVVTARGITVGATVIFEYTERQALDTGADSFVLGSTSRPTQFSRFRFDSHDGWKWDAILTHEDAVEVERTAGSLEVTGRGMEPLHMEVRRPHSRKLLPVVHVKWSNAELDRGFDSWQALGRWYLEQADPRFADRGEATRLSAELAPASRDEMLSAIAEAFRFTSRDVRYMAIDIGLGIGAGFVPASPAQVCDKRYGDCKDKALLLRALTEPWGLDTYSVLVRTRGAGPFPSEIPSPGQFNHCITAIALPEGVGNKLWSTVEVEGIGRLVFLDATVRNGSPWALRSDIQGTTALVVHPERSTLVELPVQPAAAGRAELEMSATLSEDGTVRDGRLVERFVGSRATSIRAYYEGMDDGKFEERVLAALQNRCPGSRVVEHEIEGLGDQLAPVVETTSHEAGRMAKQVGDLLILEPGKSGYGLISADLPDHDRRYPLWLGLPREERLSMRVELPAGWRPEAMPEGLRVDGSHLTADAAWSFDDGAISYERTLSLHSQEVPAAEYADFREKVLSVLREDGQAIVLVRE